MSATGRFWIGFGALSIVLAVTPAGCGDDGEEKQASVCPISGQCPTEGTQRFTYKELSQQWWQWAMSIGASKNPIIDADGSFCSGQQPAGPVWFLAGTATVDEVVKRSCTVPAGRSLFFPVIATMLTACKKDEDCEAQGHPTSTCDEEPQTDQWLTDTIKSYDFPSFVQEMEVKMDDKVIDKTSLLGHRVETGIFSIDGPTDPNEVLFPCTLGTRNAIADGYYVFIEGLAKGTHTVALSGKDVEGYTTSVEYTLQVQ